MSENIVTINKKEYPLMDTTYLKLDTFVYLKEGSNNFRDLRKTLESIVPKLAKIDARDNEILVKTLTQFFIRNGGLGNILGDGFFWFNQYPIILADKGDLIKPDDSNLECGYVAGDSKNIMDMYKKIINGVIEFGFEYYEHDIDYKFSINKVVNGLVTLLVENGHIHNYLFGFEVVELSKDKILVGENTVDVISVPKLIGDAPKYKPLSGQFSLENSIGNEINNISPKATIKYESYLSNQHKFMVVVHELLHGIFSSYDIDVLEIVKKHGKNSKMIEEEMVHRLAYFLTTTILDNEEFVIDTLNTIVNFNTGTFAEVVERHDNNISKRTKVEILQQEKQLKEAEAKEKIERIKRETEEFRIASEARVAETKQLTEEIIKELDGLKEHKENGKTKLHGDSEEEPK